VNKRVKLTKSISWNFRHKGILRKHNMSCTCGMCDTQHPMGVKKPQASFKVKEKLKTMKEAINEFFME
jgi:hypothetical protein